MKLLIDTNVLLDMVLKRNGYDISVKLFRKIREQGILACITASSVTDLFYIIRKETHDTERTYVIMENRKDYKDVSLSVLTPAEWLGLDGQY